MSIEIEAKFRVKSHEPVRSMLRSLGATPRGRVIETNCIFDRPDGWLRERGRGLRIRSLVGEGDDSDKATLTVKGPRMAGPLKSREELEIRISDADIACRAVEQLGFVRLLRYEKARESWTYRDCRIELDKPPHLGLFVEIEGPTADAIGAVQRELGLGDVPHTSDSYVRMLLEYCDEQGLVERDLPLP